MSIEYPYAAKAKMSVSVRDPELPQGTEYTGRAALGQA